MALDVLYFAWLRERIGQPRERVETEAATVRELVAELAARDEWHAAALSICRRCASPWIRNWPIWTPRFPARARLRFSHR